MSAILKIYEEFFKSELSSPPLLLISFPASVCGSKNLKMTEPEGLLSCAFEEIVKISVMLGILYENNSPRPCVTNVKLTTCLDESAKITKLRGFVCVSSAPTRPNLGFHCEEAMCFLQLQPSSQLVIRKLDNFLVFSVHFFDR